MIFVTSHVGAKELLIWGINLSLRVWDGSAAVIEKGTGVEAPRDCVNGQDNLLLRSRDTPIGSERNSGENSAQLSIDCDFYLSILNSLSLHVAVLDRQGRCVATNDAWRRFAHEHDQTYLACTGVAEHDLKICRCAAGQDDNTAQMVLSGVKEVLTGTQARFKREYACYTPGHTQWFLMLVSPLIADSAIVGAVISHMDITDRKQVEQEKAELFDALNEQSRELQKLTRRLRQLTQTVLWTQEEERLRISRELHDEAGQILTVLKYRLELLQSEIAAQQEAPLVLTVEHERELGAATQLCATAIDQVRTLAHELRPGALDDLGLNASLGALCQDFGEQMALEIVYQGAEIAGKPFKTDLPLYRCLQESLTNVARHAQATRVQVTLTDEPGMLALHVSDNGRGFDLAERREQDVPTGIGLLGMKERLESIGGSLEINSAPGRGTSIIARVPNHQEMALPASSMEP